MSHRLLAGAAALALLAAPAVATADVLRFDTVDAVDTGKLYLSGWGEAFVMVLTGTTPTGTGETIFYTHAYSGTSDPTGPLKVADQCHQKALMALAKPGRFALEVTYAITSAGVGRIERCKLIRND